MVIRLVFHFPVAERYQDGVVFQPFRFVDGKDADAFYFARRDGFLVQAFVPVGDEGGRLGRMLLHVFGHGVIERAKVGVLVLDFSHVEHEEEFLQQFVERHQAQLVEVAGECRGQASVEVALQDAVQSRRSVPDFALVCHGKPCAGDAVFGRGEVAQAVYHHAYRQRGVQPEGFVGHDAVGRMLVEIIGDGGDGFVLAHQDGDVVRADALPDERVGFLRQFFEGGFGVGPFLGVG